MDVANFSSKKQLSNFFELCWNIAYIIFLTSDSFQAAADQGDPKALGIFAEFARHLGEAVKAICYAVDPEIIVLGGSVSRSYRFFQAALWETFQTYAYSIARERLKIEVSEVENVAVLGAAALFFDAAGGPA